MGEASRTRHRTLFTLERMVAETAQVFDGVVRDRHRSSAG
jgi:hypothetical protein